MSVNQVLQNLAPKFVAGGAGSGVELMAQLLESVHLVACRAPEGSPGPRGSMHMTLFIG